MTTVLNTFQISPPPGAVAAEQSLPLTFVDFIWLSFHPVRSLYFYELPACSKPYFSETIVPNLKHSLSLTLKNFLPLAGNLVYPLNPDEFPALRYIPGDTVPLTICESSDDFDTLVVNHARDADQFYGLISQLQPVIEESDRKLIPVLALKATLFPGRGICMGFTNHHCAGHASSIVKFIRSWASINKLGGSERELLESKSESLPVFDRSLFNYPKQLKIVRDFPSPTTPFPLPTGRVRATYILRQPELEKLKHKIQSSAHSSTHVSSFVAMAAYVWSCLVKSSVTVTDEEEKEDDSLEFFLFAVDVRARLDPPVPTNYLGNCISYGLAKARRRELGFLSAADAVAKAVRDRLSEKKNNILEGAEKEIEEVRLAMQESILSVAGSTRVDLYGADFGWGKPRKLEFLSIDGEKYAMSLSKSRDIEGGLEIGMSLPNLKMEAFAEAFANGINNL